MPRRSGASAAMRISCLHQRNRPNDWVQTSSDRPGKGAGKHAGQRSAAEERGSSARLRADPEADTLGSLPGGLRRPGSGMERLGHSTPSSAMRYQDVARGRARAVADALSVMAAGNPDLWMSGPNPNESVTRRRTATPATTTGSAACCRLNGPRRGARVPALNQMHLEAHPRVINLVDHPAG